MHIWTLAVASLAGMVPPATLGQECGTPLLRVSDAADGEQGNHHAWPGYPSSGGRFVAFASYASNLLPGDDNGLKDVFWRDMETGELLLVSVALDGGFGDKRSMWPWMTCEGNLVVFDSQATNLVEDDTNGWSDVFVRDIQQEITNRVSVSSTGEQADGQAGTGTFSGDGRYVAFDSWATNLVPDDTNGRRDVFLHDLWTGETIRVSLSTTGGQGNGNSYTASLGSGGRYVGFQSVASNLAPSDPNRTSDIYVHDVSTGMTTHISVNAQGETGNRSSEWVALSGDGTYIAFSSTASNLIPDDTNGRGDIFVARWQAFPPTMERVSVSSEGGQADGGSSQPSISDDGRFVAFFSDATNLVPDGSAGGNRAYVHDRLTRTTRMISRTVTGGWGNDRAIRAFISCDATHVVFTSSSTNLVPGDINGFDDLYLRELDADLLTSGDGDCDGDIDFADFAVVQQCFTGYGGPTIGPECYALDFDFDGHVTRHDFDDYLDAVTGPQ